MLNINNKRLKKNEKDEEIEGDDDSIIQIKDSVYFSAEVENKNIIKLITKLNDAADYVLQNTTNIYNARIYLYINSYGGDAYCGLSAMDHIRCSRVPIVTIADGLVASAATLILLGGYERKSMTNAKILIHQLSTSFLGKYVDLLDEVENSKELMDNFKTVYKTYTKMSEETVDTLLKKELHMNAKKALTYGFIDEIW